MKLRRDIFSFRNRVSVIVAGILLGVLSLLYTNNMAQRLKEKERHDVALWAHAMERVIRDIDGRTINDPLIADIMNNGNNIPFVITDQDLNPIHWHLIPSELIDHPDRLRRRIDRMTEENPPSRSATAGRPTPTTTTSSSTATRRCSSRSTTSPISSCWSSRSSSCWASSPSARRSRTSRTASGSDWRRRRPTSWARPPRRCSGGSSTCARSRSIRRPSRRCRRTSPT